MGKNYSGKCGDHVAGYYFFSTGKKVSDSWAHRWRIEELIRIIPNVFGGNRCQETYEMTRFSWLPKFVTVFVDNPTMPPQGCREPAITPMGAVNTNAIYNAIDVRPYELQMTSTRVDYHRLWRW